MPRAYPGESSSYDLIVCWSCIVSWYVLGIVNAHSRGKKGTGVGYIFRGLSLLCKALAQGVVLLSALVCLVAGSLVDPAV